LFVFIVTPRISNFSHNIKTMVAMKLTSFFLSAGALVSAAPARLDARASCTFTDAAAAIKGKASCTAIVIQDMNVPAGTTLDLTKLKDGTTVTFQGTTTFGYKEWEGPLISVSGTKITVNGATGHVINANGAKWWDGKGSNGGKTKPKV
jgi:polygalacturonase